MTTPPGYYQAEGDPPDTVRYWDGTAWTTEPLPPPPGFDPDHDPRMAGVWVRIGATLLDGVVNFVVALPFMLSWFRDILDQIDADVPTDDVDVTVPGSFYVIGIVMTIVYVLMVAFLGGTPGKLMLGLRVTAEDGSTTPPGLRRGALRAIPQLASAIPVIGALIGIVIVVLSLVWVNSDYERRSPYDRVAGTRVVYKRNLPATGPGGPSAS